MGAPREAERHANLIGAKILTKQVLQRLKIASIKPLDNGGAAADAYSIRRRAGESSIGVDPD
jgi:hypothetical protein